LPGNSALEVSSGTVNLNGTSQTVGGLSDGGSGPSTGTVDLGGGALTVNQSSNSTFSGALTGGGTLTLAGTGGATLILNGDSSGFTGTTQVTGGTLQVGDANSSGATLGGSVTVGSGGTLAGHGTISGSVTNQGTTAPGGSIGTLHVGGNFAFASGSSLAQEVAANGTADLLQADGAVTIAADASVVVQPTDPIASYARVTRYTIVTGSSVSGAFGSVSSSVAGFTPVLGYGGNAVSLTLVRNDISLSTLAMSSNQSALGGAVSATPGSALYLAIAPGSDAAVRLGLDAVSGEIHATFWRRSSRPRPMCAAPCWNACAARTGRKAGMSGARPAATGATWAATAMPPPPGATAWMSASAPMPRWTSIGGPASRAAIMAATSPSPTAPAMPISAAAMSAFMAGAPMATMC
jgi:autotransporter-associated beta strand protein